MIDDDPNEEDLIRLLVGSWVALRTGTLDSEHRALLDRERPDWQAEAATLIAEGVLAYVTVEMVEPDLAHDRTVDPTDVVSAEDFTIQVTAHVLDFLDYRKDLPRVARLTTH
ncbi:hypothetical protein [Thiocapsa sp.]|uniref:hypothetical protein n=1 Tax=Thiocapsa sp. TaxID=2024551 RepID=UPI002C20A561|nr:hypothetical protein [Thiocapsa sp.]HSO82494.1 hypothetical protein [Thiocapsa sp.]